MAPPSSSPALRGRKERGGTLHRKQTLKKGAITGQRDTQLLSGNFLRRFPLMLEIFSLFRKTLRQPLHQLCYQLVRLFHSRARFVNEATLNIAPSSPKISVHVTGKKWLQIGIFTVALAASGLVEFFRIWVALTGNIVRMKFPDVFIFCMIFFLAFSCKVFANNHIFVFRNRHDRKPPRLPFLNPRN